MHGLDGRQILVNDPPQVSAPFLHIPQSPAQDPFIRVSLHIDLDIHHIPQALILEDQDSLHEDDFVGQGRRCLVRPVMDRIVVDGTLNRPSVLQLPQMPDQQVCLQ